VQGYLRITDTAEAARTQRLPPLTTAAAAAAAAAAAVLAKKPEYAAVLERMCEPERLIVFR
jgi:hypothetical protein